ncbi:iron-regulated surface protein [Staphylococcus aureus]|nr:iron-regulated surface protein [Staphylococcus aureus]
MVKDADSSVDKDAHHDVDHLSDMSGNTHFDKYDLKEMDTQIAKDTDKGVDNSVGMSSNVDTDKDSNKIKTKSYSWIILPIKIKLIILELKQTLIQ